MVNIEKHSDWKTDKVCMSYDEIIGLINDGYTPIGDLKRALHYNLLDNRNEIQVCMVHNAKIIDITEYVICDPYPCLSSFPVIRDHSYEFEYRECLNWKYR